MPTKCVRYPCKACGRIFADPCTAEECCASQEIECFECDWCGSVYKTIEMAEECEKLCAFRFRNEEIPENRI